MCPAVFIIKQTGVEQNFTAREIHIQHAVRHHEVVTFRIRFAGSAVRDDAGKIVLRFLFERKIHLDALRDVSAFFRDHYFGKKACHNQRQISATENSFPDFMLEILIKFCKHKNRTSEP